MASFSLSEAERDVWLYRVTRSVDSAYRATRRALRDRVLRSGGRYGNLWDDRLWVAAADRAIVPTLDQVYREVAFAAADDLGLRAPLGDRWLNTAVDALVAGRLPILYGVADTIGRRVAEVEVQATEESRAPGWVLNVLGLEDETFGRFAAGPMSVGLADRVAETETTAALGAASIVAFEALDVDEAEDLFGPVEDELTMEGLAGVKTWRCGMTNSRRSHIVANNQTRPAGGLFRVGSGIGAFPGDPELPAKEVLNCRCWLDVEVFPVGDEGQSEIDSRLTGDMLDGADE